MNPQSAFPAPAIPLLATTVEPCGVCVLKALREATLSFNAGDEPGIQVGEKLTNGEQIHAAATTIAGTPVCFYHADEVGKAAGL